MTNNIQYIHPGVPFYLYDNIIGENKSGYFAKIPSMTNIMASGITIPETMSNAGFAVGYKLWKCLQNNINFPKIVAIHEEKQKPGCHEGLIRLMDAWRYIECDIWHIIMNISINGYNDENVEVCETNWSIAKKFEENEIVKKTKNHKVIYSL